MKETQIATPRSVYGLHEADVRKRTGNLGQLVRVHSLVEADGPARGARLLRLINGGGLEAELHPDRGLDIGRVTIDGIPLSWMSPVGPCSPYFYDPSGDQWLRTFSGGLVSTCGLDTFGPASVDEGRDFGLHGRVGAIPAVITRATATFGELVVEGLVRQASVFGENLLLHRIVRSPVGSRRLMIEDIVSNEGYEDAPHMMLYHINLGWPLLDDNAVLAIPSSIIEPRDDAAREGMSEWPLLTSPQPGFREQVFRHSFAGGLHDQVTVSLANGRLGVEFIVRFSTTALPHLYQWKMTGQGHYVLGLEPANCPSIFGRSDARAANQLPMLRPGENVSYRLELTAERLMERAAQSPAASSLGAAHNSDRQHKLETGLRPKTERQEG